MSQLRVRNPLIGSDCELFVMDKNTKEIISGENYVKGTKYEPFQFAPDESPFFATSKDNVLAEFCIPPTKPEEKDAWVRNFLKAMDYINSSLPEHLCTTAIPSAFLDPKHLQTEQAKVFGCEPDYNVWLKETNPRPNFEDMAKKKIIREEDIPKYECLRSAGLHVHFGYDNPDEDQATAEDIIKGCDLVLKVPAILMEPENERQKLYGKAGAFRFKEYGVEYRGLSAFFASSKEYLEWVLRGAKKVVDMVNDNFPFDEYRAEILEAVNNNNRVVAGNLVRALDLETA